MPVIRTDRATRERYSQGAGIYRIVPAAVACPRDVHELARCIEWAAEAGVSVIPRGAGSGMAGGNVGDGVVVDLTGMAAHEPDVDAVRRRVRVDAGLALSQVTTAAADHRLRFGPDPSSAGWATIGGIISTNAAGARSHGLGAVDRWVESVELITADGPLCLDRERPADTGHPAVHRFTSEAEPLLRAHRQAILRHAPRTTKNTAGYGLGRFLETGALVDLVIGSEGTLGVITAATLRLEPIPTHRATMQLALPERAAIPAVVEALRAVSPIAIELFDRSLLRLVADRLPVGNLSRASSGTDALLICELEADDQPALDRRVTAASGALAGLARQIVVARTAEESAAIWALRHQASPILAGLGDGRRSLQVIEDGCVPLAALPAYLDAVDSACRDTGLDAVMFGHAGDGHVHVNLLPDLGREDWLDAVRIVFDRVTEVVLALGGTPAGEHGAGRLRAALLERTLGREALTCMVAVKGAFDPDQRFNPGVILPTGADPLSRLKVGAGAESIDPTIADALARIEVDRTWGESRWDDR